VAHYGTLGDVRFADASEDIRGASLYGLNDEKLGTIDDVIFDHSTGTIGYLVVDTGGWLSSKEFIVPADNVSTSTKHSDDFQVPLNKKQVESFPPYKESDLESETKWKDYETSYRSKWTGPIMHREGTDRNITPTPQQMSGNKASEDAAAAAHGWLASSRPTSASIESQESDVEAAEMPTGRVVPAGADTVVIDNSAVGIGGRWDTFQSRLRERRKEAVTGCSTCTNESATKRGSESVDTLRKAV